MRGLERVEKGREGGETLVKPLILVVTQREVSADVELPIKVGPEEVVGAVEGLSGSLEDTVFVDIFPLPVVGRVEVVPSLGPVVVFGEGIGVTVMMVASELVDGPTRSYFRARASRNRAGDARRGLRCSRQRRSRRR